MGRRGEGKHREKYRILASNYIDYLQIKPIRASFIGRVDFSIVSFFELFREFFSLSCAFASIPLKIKFLSNINKSPLRDEPSTPERSVFF
jgi:hypothetical protein